MHQRKSTLFLYASLFLLLSLSFSLFLSSLLLRSRRLCVFSRYGRCRCSFANEWISWRDQTRMLPSSGPSWRRSDRATGASRPPKASVSAPDGPRGLVETSKPYPAQARRQPEALAMPCLAVEAPPGPGAKRKRTSPGEADPKAHHGTEYGNRVVPQLRWIGRSTSAVPEARLTRSPVSKIQEALETVSAVTSISSILSQIWVNHQITPLIV